MKYVLFMLAALSMVGCSKMTAEDLEKILKEKPELVFNVIENNPEKFLKAAQTAARKIRPPQGAPEENIEEEFKNPKSPEIVVTRILGKQEAPILIVEYTDLECPFCSRGKTTMAEVLKAYGDQVKVVMKHLPLPMHPHARPGAQYFEAIVKVAGLEKAHQWSEEIFKAQGEFRKGEPEKFFDTTAKKVKVDPKKVKAVLQDEKQLQEIDGIINADMEEARKFGFQGTPGYLINGVSLRGAYPLPMFKQVIDRHLQGKK